MIVIKNVFGGSQVYIKNVFANAENIVVVYNGGEPISITGGGGGSGDVVGPSSATDNAIARFNLTTGKLIQNSGATIDDSGNITANNLSGTNTGDQDLSGKSDVGHTHVKADIVDFSDADYAPALGVDDNYVTDAEKTKLANLSGTNTGDQDLSSKQDVLVSGTNIKTVNSTSLLGSGDVAVQATLVSGTNIKTINSSSILGSGDLVVGQSIYDIDLALSNALGAAFIAQNFPLNMANSASTRAGLDNRMDYYALYLPTDQTITGVKWIQAVQGNYTGDNYNGWGLYSYSGGTLTLRASSTNDSEIWKGTANTMQTKAFSSTYAATAGVYFLAWLYCQSAQTTAPSMYAKPNLPTGYNGAFTNSAALAFSQTGQTALPTPTVATTSLSSLATQSWVAIY
jgi:hypothetical protein